MWTENFHATGRLMRFILRRDRLRIPIWLVSIIAITFLTASSLAQLYPSDEERQVIAETMNNPAMIAMVGPGYGLDHYTEGAMMAHQMLLFTAVVVAIMNILLVARHTRTEEEEGRTELLRSLPVGRLANVSATLIVLLLTNIVLASGVSLSLLSLQIDSMDAAGSWIYGSALGATGFFFAAVTIIFAQLCESSRGTIGFPFAVLGAAFLLRAIGDVSNETLSLFSPLGWTVAVKAFVVNQWWPVLLLGGIAVTLAVFALFLYTARDFQAGFFPTRRGRRTASRFLTGPFGLAFKLQRTAIISWFIGMLILGVSYGSIFGDLESFFESNEMISELLPITSEFSLSESFLAKIMSLIAIFSTIPGILFATKLKSEENQARNEPLLTHAISRLKLMATYSTLGLVGSVMMLGAATFGLIISMQAVVDDPITTSTIIQSAAVYVPAMWLVIALSISIIGVRPQLSSLIWLYIGFSFFVVYLGDLLNVPEWIQSLSPFGHVPQVPLADVSFLSILTLSAICLILITTGHIAYRRRDLAG
ncbi:ABC transporter permease [Shouchella lonarensis]|uniref:ABC-2 type transport system permease protein n=1 Tax=Shouchella lonarensis TaxID=1464122 RepID=A0A1G6HFC2_9BACI|nr:ABC-2 transporter permease [Shouchella lonarensis]SDB92939.1 ABC-2 type transport system permease protein [Shouchella lonarensis]